MSIACFSSIGLRALAVDRMPLEGQWAEAAGVASQRPLLLDTGTRHQELDWYLASMPCRTQRNALKTPDVVSDNKVYFWSRVEDEPESERPRSQISQATSTTSQSPKKKISLSAYKSKQAEGTIATAPNSKLASPSLASKVPRRRSVCPHTRASRQRAPSQQLPAPSSRHPAYPARNLQSHSLTASRKLGRLR
jgi:hypothetical protein